MGRKRIQFQLYELGSIGGMAKKLIQDSGGVVYVAQDGDPAKQSITDKDGAALSNPRALTNGYCEFYVADTVARVDLFIQCPGGQFVVAPNVDESIADIGVDVTRLNHVMVIPWYAGDVTAAAETDTGFDLPLHAAVLPTPLLRVHTVDATETIDVGLLSSETAGDADGFIAAASVATAGLIKATVVNGGNTMGALFEVQDSANAGDLTHEPHVITGSNATSVTLTTTAGSDTGKGYIILPYLLANAANLGG